MTEVPNCSGEHSFEMFEQYKDMVYRLALSSTKNKSDAEDVFQDVFLTLVKRKVGFESAEHEKAWLIRVTINRSKKLLSSAWFRHTVPLDKELCFETHERSEVFFAVTALPLKYRTVIYLFYYEDLSVDQIAHILNFSSGTVKSQLFRARKLLKDTLKGDFNDV